MDTTEAPLKKSDLQVEMESLVPPLEERASSGDFQGALDALMGLEKKGRMVSSYLLINLPLGCFALFSLRRCGLFTPHGPLG